MLYLCVNVKIRTAVRTLNYLSLFNNSSIDGVCNFRPTLCEDPSTSVNMVGCSVPPRV